MQPIRHWVEPHVAPSALAQRAVDLILDRAEREARRRAPRRIVGRAARFDSFALQAPPKAEMAVSRVVFDTRPRRDCSSDGAGE